MAESSHPALWVGLLGTPLLIATGQVLFKLTSARTGGADVKGLFGLLTDPLLIVALAIYGFGTIVWIFVLKQVPLTIAYSFMGLTFVFVPLLAQVWLGEQLTLRYALGAALIIGGMIVVNS